MWTIRLIVIGIVVAVALSQRERRISLQASPLPRRPFNFPGAQPIPIQGAGRATIRVPQQNRPIVRIASADQRRPVVRTSPRQNVIAVPRPAPPRQQAPVQVPAQQIPVFRDEDFDYLEEVGFNDADFLLPLPTPPVQQAQQPRPQPAQATQQAFRPVEVRAQSPAPAQNVRAIAKAPAKQQAPRRQGTPNTFRQEFNIKPQTQEEAARGQKEPAVQIIKSWSNRNADGTFSWGYINTDGSFKNETKGVDCVVRGVYGYIDEDTGETVTFPYESGNPCDPNSPDYYFDYDEGAIVSQGQVVQRPRNVGQNIPRRN